MSAEEDEAMRMLDRVNHLAKGWAVYLLADPDNKDEAVITMVRRAITNAVFDWLNEEMADPTPPAPAGKPTLRVV